MHKGIRLDVRLWIEGEDEPAHDFAEHTIKAVREMLAAGQFTYPKLQETIRKIEEDTSWEEDENP
jgi:hypothetical protein